MAIIDRKMVELIGKFYKAQESMKFLYGDKYPKEVADTKVVVDKYKAAFKCDTLQAVKKPPKPPVNLFVPRFYPVFTLILPRFYPDFQFTPKPHDMIC